MCSQCYGVCAHMCPILCDSMAVALQVPLSMELSQQQYCSVLTFPTPWDLLKTGIKPPSLASPTLAGRFFFTTVPPGKWRRKWQPIPVFLLGEVHGQRSLVAIVHGGHN